MKNKKTIKKTLIVALSVLCLALGYRHSMVNTMSVTSGNHYENQEPDTNPDDYRC